MAPVRRLANRNVISGLEGGTILRSYCDRDAVELDWPGRFGANGQIGWSAELGSPGSPIDLAPDQVGPSWYALRFWIELGFKALKSWKWDKTRRTDPTRVSLVGPGLSMEDAQERRIAPGNLRAPPTLAPPVERTGRTAATG